MGLGWCLALVVSGGCSVIAQSNLPLIYRFYFDNLVEDRLSGFMDLTDEQEDFVEANIERYVAWHRYQVLPRYSDFLEAQAVLIRRGGITRADVERGEDAARTLWFDSVEPLASWMSQVMVAQSHAQLRSMEEEWKERHLESTEVATKPLDERIEESIERVVDVFEDFFVDVEAPQQREIKRWVTELAGRPQSWVSERERRWRVLLVMLRSGAPRAKVEDYLRKLYADPVELSSQSYREAVQQLRASFREFLRRLLNSLTQEQREQFADHFEDLARDFRRLAERS